MAKPLGGRISFVWLKMGSCPSPATAHWWDGDAISSNMSLVPPPEWIDLNTTTVLSWCLDWINNTSRTVPHKSPTIVRLQLLLRTHLTEKSCDWASEFFLPASSIHFYQRRLSMNVLPYKSVNPCISVCHRFWQCMICNITARRSSAWWLVWPNYGVPTEVT